MRYYTYVHYRNDTNSPFYVGKGCDNRYKSSKVRNRWWHHIVDKAGFTPIIIAHWDTPEEAYEHERFLISCFRDLKYELVNQTDGGDGSKGWKHSEEHKNDNSKRSKDLWASEDFRLKRATSIELVKNTDTYKMAHKAAAEKRAKSRVLVTTGTNIDTGEIIYLYGATDTKSKGFTPSAISNACKSGKAYKNYTWTR